MGRLELPYKDCYRYNTGTVLLTRYLFLYRRDCNYIGLHVMVIFTVFSGIDSSELLFPLAQEYNISVLLGLPSLSRHLISNSTVTNAYMKFMARVVESHERKFGNYSLKAKKPILQGFFWSEDFLLSDILDTGDFPLAMVLQGVSNIVHGLTSKSVGVSTWVSTNKRLSHSTLQLYVGALTNLARFWDVDFVSVRDGLGSGVMAPYWDTQRATEIQVVDKGLFDVLKLRFPDMEGNVTYEDMFTASSNEVVIIVGLFHACFSANR